MMAIISEPKHISRTEIIRALRRPYWSARCPKSQPPIGRTMNPSAKSIAAFSCCTTGSLPGKNAAAKYSAKAAYA